MPHQSYIRLIFLSMIIALALHNSLFGQPLTWRKIGDLRQARNIFGALPISSNQILVMGGYTRGIVTAACEMIDIDSRSISNAASMNAPRAEAVFLLTRDSNIVAISGLTNTDNSVTPLCELFDRTRRTWTIIGRLRQGRRQHVACFLNDEEILVVGGRDENITTLQTAEIFNVRTGQSREIENFPTPLNLGQCGLSSQNKPWVFAGRAGGANSSRTRFVYEYNIQNDTWVVVSDIMRGLQAASSLRLWDRRLVLTGGSRLEQPTDYSENVFVERDVSLRLISQMSIGRSWHTTAQWNADSILVLGGFDNSNTTLPSTEWIHLPSGRISAAPTMAVGHSQFVALGMPLFNAAGQQTKARIVAISGRSNTSAETPIVEILEADIQPPLPPPPTLPPFPAISSQWEATNDCTVFRLRLRAASGMIRAVALGTSANVRLEIQTPLPAQAVEITVRLQNPFATSALSSVRITDDLNRTETIPITASFPLQTLTALRINTELTRDLTRLFGDSASSPICAQVSLRNTTAQEVVLPSVSLVGNIAFSTPPSQFPLRIPAGGLGTLHVCYAPSAQGTQRDTVFVVQNCAVLQIPLLARGAGAIYSTSSRCDAPLQVRSILPQSPESNLALFTPRVTNLFPQPSDEVLEVSFIMAVQNYGAIAALQEAPSLRLYSALGVLVRDFKPNSWQSSTKNIDMPHYEGTANLDVRSLPTGVYQLVLENREGLRSAVQILIAH